MEKENNFSVMVFAPFPVNFPWGFSAGYFEAALKSTPVPFFEMGPWS